MSEERLERKLNKTQMRILYEKAIGGGRNLTKRVMASRLVQWAKKRKYYIGAAAGAIAAAEVGRRVYRRPTGKLHVSNQRLISDQAYYHDYGPNNGINRNEVKQAVADVVHVLSDKSSSANKQQQVDEITEELLRYANQADSVQSKTPRSARRARSRPLVGVVHNIFEEVKTARTTEHVDQVPWDVSPEDMTNKQKADFVKAHVRDYPYFDELKKKLGIGKGKVTDRQANDVVDSIWYYFHVQKPQLNYFKSRSPRKTKLTTPPRVTPKRTSPATVASQHGLPPRRSPTSSTVASQHGSPAKLTHLDKGIAVRRQTRRNYIPQRKRFNDGKPFEVWNGKF